MLRWRARESFRPAQNSRDLRSDRNTAILKILVIFALTEILRSKELLRANDLRALLRRALGQRKRLFEIGGRVRGTSSLQQPQIDHVAGGRTFHENLRLGNTGGMFDQLGAAARVGGCGDRNGLPE